MPFKFLRFFYHYYHAPTTNTTTMNPFIVPPPPGPRRSPRSDNLPIISIVDAHDAAGVQAVARVLRQSAGDAASTRAQFATTPEGRGGGGRRGAEGLQRRLKELQTWFVRDVRAMGFDGWLYKLTTTTTTTKSRNPNGGGDVDVVVGGAFLERVDAGWRHVSFRGACRAFWVVRRPQDDGGPGLGRARHDDVWLRHMREMHGRLYALVDRLARQQVFVLTAIGIRDEYRNQGIGTQLLRHIETHIGRNNVIVVVSDRRGESFFAKNGFEVAEEPGTDSRHMPTVIMLKNHETPLVHRRGD